VHRTTVRCHLSAIAQIAQEHCLDNVDKIAPTLRLLAMHSAGDLAPMCAFLGGVIGQEVMKVTGKFTPLHQWLHFDIAEMLHELPAPEYEPLQSRYDGLVAVFGRSFQRKLAALKLFLVGAGALGSDSRHERPTSPSALSSLATQARALAPGCSPSAPTNHPRPYHTPRTRVHASLSARWIPPPGVVGVQNQNLS